MELGQKLKNARTKASLSQETLAQKLEVSRQTISNWENSRSYPDIGSLIKLSDLYGLSLDELLKEDKAVQEHYESLTQRRRNFWQMMLEVGIVLELVGWLLQGQDFSVFGTGLAWLGVGVVYVSICMHLRFFDHSAAEIRCGIGGMAIQLVCLVIGLWKPELSNNAFLSLLRIGGIVLIWMSGVWKINWKSTRLWLIIVLYLGVPLFTMATHLQDTGSLNEDTPFSFEYRIEEVLYPEDSEGWERRKVYLEAIFSEHHLKIAENGTDYEDIGIFTYVEPVPEQSTAGIWQLIPEDDPSAMYKVTVESDGKVLLSYSENEQLQYKWLLSRVDTASVVVATFGKTMATSPNWYPAGTEDPEPHFSNSDVLKTAKMTITVEGLDTETLTLVEEYHHGDEVDFQTLTLEPIGVGTFFLEIETRYEDEQQYALYRIPFHGGEYRFTLTYS